VLVIDAENFVFDKIKPILILSYRDALTQKLSSMPLFDDPDAQRNQISTAMLDICAAIYANETALIKED
jgi:hypothetical protein